VRALALAWLCLALGMAAGCHRPAPRDELPSGAYLAGDGAALRRLLERVERHSSVPLGRGAGRILERVAGCERVAGHAPDAALRGLVESLGCAAQLPAAVTPLLANADLALVLPLGDAGRLVGGLRVDARGSLALDARVELGDVRGAAQLLVPDEQPPGLALLNTDDTLLHGRYRSDGGLNLAQLVPAGSQADQLFRLRSQLFAGAVLDGSWELAVYLPEDSAMPPIALAVGHRLRSAAVAAMEKFIADLRASWPVTRRAASLGGIEGACLDELRLLPELAPCYVATERALVVGWNAASLTKALARGAGTGPAESGGLVVHLDRLPEADARLQRMTGTPSLPTLDYVWRRLEARAQRQGGAVQLAVELRAGDDS
jgi:hypothetical protein